MTAAEDRSQSLPDAAATAFETNDAMVPTDPSSDAAASGVAAGAAGAAAAVDGPAYAVESTAFDAVVTATPSDGVGHRYEVVVQIPSLDAATADHVGPAVQSGWFETMERRLAEAPKATRATVDLSQFRLATVEDAEALRVTYAFEYGDADRAATIAKTFVEYVEGTYVESTIPGYEYEDAVGDLLATATGTGGAAGDGPGGTGGSTPL